jgi:hypothetical protein
MPSKTKFPMPKKLVTIGDLQGNLDGLKAILRATKLISKTGQWTGGSAHLVQVGDIFGRAADPRGVVDLLRKLTGEARAAGGHVTVLLGNHEAEVVHRYEFECDPKEYLAFATGECLKKWQNERERAEEAFWDLDEESSLPLANLVKAWEMLHPLGREEFRSAVGPGGVYGKWIMRLPTVIRIGDIILSHAGILPEWAEKGMDGINWCVREDMGVDLYFPALPDGNALIDPNGPLWTREYAWGKRGAEKRLLASLRILGATAQIMGHTPTRRSRIIARYDGRAVFVDTGIGRPKTGRVSALVVEKGAYWAYYPPRERRDLGPVPSLLE